jgi:hypothetical protein
MAARHQDDCHPSPEELERFLLGELSPRQASPVLAHLLQGCTPCQAKMEPMSAVMFGAGRDVREIPQETGSEYDFPLFKALATARRYAASVQTKAEKADRMASSLRTAPLLAAADPTARLDGRDQDWLRCEKLIEMCRELRYSDPEDLVLTATLAVEIAERLDPDLRDVKELADLQAYALAELGNARRVSDDFSGADAELARGMERAGRGTGSPVLLAHLMDLTASLYIDQSRFEEARLLFDAAYMIHRRAGDSHSTGRALISKGFSAVNSLE